MGEHHGGALYDKAIDERRRKIAENQKKAEDSFGEKAKKECQD